MSNDDKYELTTRHIAVTVEVLAFLNSLAMMNGYDKTVYPQFFSVYDMYQTDTREEKDRVYANPTYPATLMMSMLNSTRKEVPCEQHVRTLWRVICKEVDAVGNLQRIDVWIDIPIDAFDCLPDVPESMVMYENMASDLSSLDNIVSKDIPVLSLEELQANEALVSDIESFLQNGKEEE